MIVDHKSLTCRPFLGGGEFKPKLSELRKRSRSDQILSMTMAGAMPPAAHMVTSPRFRSRRSSSSRTIPIRIEPVAPIG